VTTELTFTEISERQLRWMLHTALGDETRVAVVAVDRENELLRRRLADTISNVEHERQIRELHAAYQQKIRKLGGTP